MTVKGNKLINAPAVHNISTRATIDIGIGPHADECVVTWQIDVDGNVKWDAWHRVPLVFIAGNKQQGK